MSEIIRFDDSLPRFIEFLLDKIPAADIEKAMFLRDAAGKLTFVVDDIMLDAEKRRKFSEAAAAILSPYVDNDGFAIATPDELFDETLGSGSGWVQKIVTNRFDGAIRLLDRRVVGADWLRPPAPLSTTPRLVFASLKGGVGRSTALCVAAASLAASGKRVLAVDMDVEAPGLGTMLLTADTMPRFGLLDYFVESNLSDIDLAFLQEMIAPSWLPAGQGVVDVIPALGTSSISWPQNAISKISRAYLDHTGGNSIYDRFGRLLNLVSSDYDTVLIDARAGLHETTAAALLGAGAQILFFGIDQPQTIAGYDLLFANFALLGELNWAERLAFIQAKAPGDAPRKAGFASKIRETLRRRLRPITSDPSPDLHALRDVFKIDWEVEAVAAQAADKVLEEVEELEAFKVVPVYDSDIFREFDPLSDPTTLTSPKYSAVFGEFIGLVCDSLETGSGSGNEQD